MSSSNNGVDLSFRDRPAETFDRVVLTTPAPIISKACPDLTDDEHRRLNGLRYQGIVCASLLLKKPLAKYYVTNITDDWVPFTAVIEMTTLVDPAEFGGRTLVYLPKYVSPDDPLFEVSDADLRTSFIAALKKMYPHFEESDVEAFRVSRVRHVVALSTLNYSAQLPPMKTSLPGVFAVNSAHIVNGTLNVNETVKLAEHRAWDEENSRPNHRANAQQDQITQAECTRQTCHLETAPSVSEMNMPRGRKAIA